MNLKLMIKRRKTRSVTQGFGQKCDILKLLLQWFSFVQLVTSLTDKCVFEKERVLIIASESFKTILENDNSTDDNTCIY